MYLYNVSLMCSFTYRNQLCNKLHDFNVEAHWLIQVQTLYFNMTSTHQGFRIIPLERKNRQFQMYWDLNLKYFQHILEDLDACPFVLLLLPYVDVTVLLSWMRTSLNRQLVMPPSCHQKNGLLSTMLKSKGLLKFPKFNSFVPNKKNC